MIYNHFISATFVTLGEGKGGIIGGFLTQYIKHLWPGATLERAEAVNDSKTTSCLAQNQVHQPPAHSYFCRHMSRKTLPSHALPMRQVHTLEGPPAPIDNTTQQQHKL